MANATGSGPPAAGREDGWRRDLHVNAKRFGLKGAVVGWYMNPGFAVATLYRIMRWGHVRGGVLGKAVSVIAWRRIYKGYGCDISPRAVIGPGLRLPHPLGIVIGEGTTIGRDATVYQGVTMGRRTDAAPDYPVLGDRVTAYAGAVIAGAAVIGDDATIGALAVVPGEVPANAVALSAVGRLRTGEGGRGTAGAPPPPGLDTHARAPASTR